MSDIYNIKKQVINNSFHYHNHYHDTEHSEPVQEILLNQSHDDTDSIVEADTGAVTARTFSQRVRSLEPVKQRLLLALKGSSKAYMNQEELRACIHVNTEDMVDCLRSNPKLFGMRKEGLAFIWYLTKQGKRLKKLKAPKLAAKRAYQSNNRKGKNN